MPKPFRDLYTAKDFAFGFDTAAAIPAIAARVGSCVTSWSYVEHQMAVLLGVLINAENEASIAAFSAIKNSNQQRSALEAAAKKLLSEAERDLLKRILLKIQLTSEKRNTIAHGLWGVVGGVEDRAVLISQSDMSGWNASVLIASDKGQYNPNFEVIAERLEVYEFQDFDEIASEIQLCWRLLFGFLSIVRKSKAQTFGLNHEELLEFLNSNAPKKR